MGDQSEREKTTEYASERIKSFLEKSEADYISALLLSSVYVNLRLRTLLTDWVKPPRNNWKRVSSEVINCLDFHELIVLCSRYKLLINGERKKLEKLRKKRNHVAHESTLWKKLKERDKKQISSLCNFAIQFLERTNR